LIHVNALKQKTSAAFSAHKKAASVSEGRFAFSAFYFLRLGRCGRGRGCRLVRAGVTGRCVNDDSRVLVVAHEFGVGGRELAAERGAGGGRNRLARQSFPG